MTVPRITTKTRGYIGRSTEIQFLVKVIKELISFSCSRGARLGHWREDYLPTNMGGFESRKRSNMWVDFVAGFALAPRGLSPGTLVFYSPLKFSHER